MKRILCCLFLLLWPLSVSAQTTRFELGQRLRAFETAWDQQPDAAGRKRAVPLLDSSVKGFFSGKFAEVGRTLDRARLALYDAEEPAPRMLWAQSLYLKPESRFVDLARGKLPLVLEAFYPVEAQIPPQAKVNIELWSEERLVGGKKTVTITSAELGVKELPLACALDLKQFTDGEHTLSLSVRVADQVLAGSTQTIALASNLEERLKKLKATAEAMPAEPTTTANATLRGLIGPLDRLAQQETLETNYPAARLLVEAEDLAKHLADGMPYYGKTRAGQFWLTLAGKANATVRIAVPETAKAGKPLPLVLALHGAGGSENLFFDGYGNGTVVKLCQERGWLLAAPRSGLLGGVSLPAVIDELAALYPVDRQRVFVVGHSMGAGQAVTAAQQAPERFTGVAALGGSGRVGKDANVRTLPFFVGVGDKDFALRGARALTQALKDVGAKEVRYKEYADIEHLVIVQVALADVFMWFDELAKR